MKKVTSYYEAKSDEEIALALGKVLLLEPRILLLDEPTKGLDRAARAAVAERVAAAAADGATVLLSTHDADFVRAVADSVSLVFDGGVAATEPTGEFLSGSWLYRQSRAGSSVPPA